MTYGSRFRLLSMLLVLAAISTVFAVGCTERSKSADTDTNTSPD